MALCDSAHKPLKGFHKSATDTCLPAFSAGLLSYHNPLLQGSLTRQGSFAGRAAAACK